MCIGSHQLLRPGSLGFHSASNSDAPGYLRTSTHDVLLLLLTRELSLASSYLSICALHGLQSTPSHIPGHTGLPKGEMALHSGYTHGDLGTGDSDCHSLKDKSQAIRKVCSFARGSGPLCQGSNTFWGTGQSTPRGVKEPGFFLWSPYLRVRGQVTSLLWASGFSPWKWE